MPRHIERSPDRVLLHTAVYDFALELNFVRTKALRLKQLAVWKSNQVFTTEFRDRRRCRDGGEWDLFPQFRNLDY